jgi:hypothetical protein
MTERKKASVARHAGSPVPSPPDPGPLPAKRRHLEGLGWYLVYVPCLIIATLSTYLFIAAVERWLYGDD